MKRGHLCEQEQLASDLDRALSLSQLSSLTAARKLSANPKVDKLKGKAGEFELREHGVHSSKGGKHKLPAKLSSQSVHKVKGQKKTSLFSSVRSELSSCSNSEYLPPPTSTLTEFKSCPHAPSFQM